MKATELYKVVLSFELLEGFLNWVSTVPYYFPVKLVVSKLSFVVVDWFVKSNHSMGVLTQRMFVSVVQIIMLYRTAVECGSNFLAWREDCRCNRKAYPFK